MKINPLYLIPVAIMAVCCNSNEPTIQPKEITWHGWNRYQIPETDSLANYGYRLISNTAYFLGPKGTVMQISNGMNCQNCHLEGGTIPWGNNYSAVVATYPKYRDRSGSIESIAKRVNDCFERSLNGKPIDSTGREMKAIIAYLHWLGDEIPKGKKPLGSGIMDIPFINRAADPLNGKKVYTSQCQSCHSVDGAGQKNPEGYGYTYPPLWGPNSYNIGAGLFRLSRLAGYVKNNMPFQKTSYSNSQLSDEEAWDVAAYINSQPRPSKELGKDWPIVSKKPADYPFGPYTDTFTEKQHKYGPFEPIKNSLSRSK